MKKFLKVFGITILSILAIIYLLFLFVVPNILDAKAFKPQILKEPSIFIIQRLKEF